MFTIKKYHLWSYTDYMSLFATPPAGAKAIILNCPESDIILSQFRLEPIGSNPVVVWASKVMLRER